MNVNMTVETKADAEVYVTTRGSDALESDSTLSPGGAADGDGHEEIVAAERREPSATPPYCEMEEVRRG